MTRTWRAAPPRLPAARRRWLGRSRWRGLTRAAILLTATAVTAGCAAQPAVTAAAAPPAGPPGGSRAEALAAGRRALRAIALPAGSRRYDGFPLPAPLRGLPISGGTGYVGPYLVYRLPVPMWPAGRYLLAHLGAGLVSYGIAQSGHVNGPTTMVTVTSDLRQPPAGIAELQLYENVVAGPDGSSLLLAQALVTWYPPRSGAQYLTPARFRLIRITAVPAQGSPVTTDSRGFIVAVADAVDRLPAMPGGLPHSCPPVVSIYRLVLVPATRSQPAVVINANSCEADAVTVDGRAQPWLQDIGNSVYRLTDALVRGSHD